ncbi:sensor histidine kinase, partial [Rhodococcus sp. EPR-134]
GSAGELVLDVHDDGPGIEPQARERVFDRFIRGGSTDGGTGLGLAIAKWAVELHDGRIAVVDAPSGCCIRVVLPQN